MFKLNITQIEIAHHITYIQWFCLQPARLDSSTPGNPVNQNTSADTFRAQFVCTSLKSRLSLLKRFHRTIQTKLTIRTWVCIGTKWCALAQANDATWVEFPDLTYYIVLSSITHYNLGNQLFVKRSQCIRIQNPLHKQCKKDLHVLLNQTC